MVNQAKIPIFSRWLRTGKLSSPNEISSLSKSVLALATFPISYMDRPKSLHHAKSQILPFDGSKWTKKTNSKFHISWKHFQFHVTTSISIKCIVSHAFNKTSKIFKSHAYLNMKLGIFHLTPTKNKINKSIWATKTQHQHTTKHSNKIIMQKVKFSFPHLVWCSKVPQNCTTKNQNYTYTKYEIKYIIWTWVRLTNIQRVHFSKDGPHATKKMQ